MKKALILLLTVQCLGETCPDVKFINMSPYKINVRDYKAIQFNIKSCKRVFPETPCLIKFIKKDIGTYNVVCGKEVQ